MISKLSAWRVIGIASAAAVLSGCTKDDALGRVGMPAPATEEAPRILSLWQGSWLAAMIVAVFVWGLIIAAVIKFRRREGDPLPKQTKYNIPIEILYTIAPLIMIIGLFSFVARDQAALTALKGDQTHTVDVVGYRWSWAFNYTDEGVYETGTPDERPTLWLPVDEKVRFNLHSPDVDHSFWIPAFLMKMDVIPGRVNSFDVTPNKVGEYAGKCAELCGVDHTYMLFDVKVVDRAEYDAHIAELKAAGQTGTVNTGRMLNAGES